MNPAKEIYSHIPEKIRQKAKPDMFTSIDVGLSDWCNRSCSYCPVSLFPSRHGPKSDILSQEAWTNLIESLSKINYAGRLSPHHYNEPLLDAHHLLIPRLGQARNVLPNCNITIYTNGDLLHRYIDDLARLGVGLVVSLHEGRYSQELEKLIKSGELLAKIPKTEIKDLRINALFDRTPNIAKDRLWHPAKCPNYSWHDNTLVINPKGDVVTCVQDYGSEKTWGNINHEDIMDIWKKSDFWKFREQRRLNQAEGLLMICHTCLGK